MTNLAYAPGPGDFHDMQGENDFASTLQIERIERELWADPEMISEVIADLIWYRRGGRNHPKALSAINAFRDSDYVEFGRILSDMCCQEIHEKAQDRLVNPDEYE